jgi:hypothetical protein
MGNNFRYHDVWQQGNKTSREKVPVRLVLQELLPSVMIRLSTDDCNKLLVYILIRNNQAAMHAILSISFFLDS